MKTDPVAAAKALVGLLMLALPTVVPTDAMAQGAGQGRWAKAGDPLAKRLIELERQWAVLACDKSSTAAATSAKLIGGFIADDFVGTSPGAALYTKHDMLAKPATPPGTERDCKLISAKVRYFGSDIAVIYGRESAVVKGPDGKEAPRSLVWTDTLMRRAGKWQAIAVQDMVAPAP